MLTPDELVKQLHSPRLPIEIVELTLQDCLAAFGIGVLAALLVYIVLQNFMTKRISLKDQVAKELYSFHSLSSQERLFHQASLRASISDRPVEDLKWTRLIYGRCVEVDHDALDAEIISIVSQRGL